jgi:hypothetical protein
VQFSQQITYRIDGVEGPGEAPAEYGRWHFIGVHEGVARFVDHRAEALMLSVDRLVEVDHGHLCYSVSSPTPVRRR